jgi:hypothetical protein
MTRLGAVISEAIVHHYGRDELLRRLAHPFWFNHSAPSWAWTDIPLQRLVCEPSVPRRWAWLPSNASDLVGIRGTLRGRPHRRKADP